MAQQTGRPMVFVRKQAKPYGTRQATEGPPITGQRVVIVEDVVTTGGAVLAAAGQLRAAGAMVDTVVCAIDREQAGRPTWPRPGSSCGPPWAGQISTRPQLERHPQWRGPPIPIRSGTIRRVGLDIPLWRAVALFRVAALGYAVILMAGNNHWYPHPAVGWFVVLGMAVWTAFAAWAYAEPSRRGWPLIMADVAAAAAAEIASRWAIDHQALILGAATLPMAWVAGPVLACAVWRGRRLGAIAAVVLALTDGFNRGVFNPVTLNGFVLLLLTGMVIGYLAHFGAGAEGAHRATETQAANRERERLAR